MSDIKSVLRQLYVEALRLDRAPETIPDQNLTAVLGLDSINSLEVLIVAENHFKIQIDDADLSVALVDSLDVLAAYVEKKLAAGESAQGATARSAELV
jgi:acyl carrier protein